MRASQSFKTPFKLTLMAAAFAALAACQTTPERNTELDTAQSAWSQASTDPRVQRYSAAELEQLRQKLESAQATWTKEHDAELARHQAYMITQQAALLRAQSERKDAEVQVEKAGAERDRVRLEARNSEVERLRQREDVARRAALEASNRANSLESDLAALKAQSTQRGMTITLRDVLFAPGHYEIQSGALRSIQQIAEVLKDHPERRVLIEGFTDSTGDDAMNQELSEQRAAAVRNALVSSGVPVDRIEVRAFGEQFPTADNNTAAGRQQNRRVEVLFSDQAGKLNYR